MDKSCVSVDFKLFFYVWYSAATKSLGNAEPGEFNVTSTANRRQQRNIWLATGREKPNWPDKALLLPFIHQRLYVYEPGLEVLSLWREVCAWYPGCDTASLKLWQFFLILWLYR